MIEIYPPAPGIVLAIILVTILLFMSAMISGCKTAFFSLLSKDKKILTEMNTRSSIRVLRILKHPDRLLATVLISNNFVKVGIVIISAFIFSKTFNFSELPVPGFLIQVTIITLLILLFGEIIPKIYASNKAVGISLMMSYPISIIEKIFYPLSSLLLNSTSFVNRKLALNKDIASMDELNDAFDLTTGVITEDKKMLKSIVKFSDIDVNDIMHPRLDIIAVEIETDFRELIDVINESGYSRIPIYTDTFDNINGILFVKDLLPFLGKPDQFKWQELIRPCYFVPQTKKINALLQEFLAKKIHMAIVVDEYGGTEGIVTLEDVLEEIVGEITDESDEIETYYTRLDELNYIFDAKILLNDFYKIVQVPKDLFENIRGDADTLAGLILEIKGEIPKLNEIINLKNYTFRITSVDNRRIKKLKFTIEKPVKNTN